MSLGSQAVAPAEKKCGRCQTFKPADAFSRCRSRKDGLHTRCKECPRSHYMARRDSALATMRDYREKNREQLLSRHRQYWHSNKEIRLKKQRDYHADNRESIYAQQREYRDKNKDLIAQRNRAQYLKNKPARAEYGRQWNAKKRESDPLFRLKSNLRTRTSAAIRRGGFTKASGLVEIMGCDWETLYAHITARLDPGMTWDNYGKAWVIDHHIPLASAKGEQEIIALCHYTNLRPLDKTENLRKAAKVPLAMTAQGVI